MTSRKSIIVYITQPLGKEIEASLIKELAAQHIQSSSPNDLPDHFELSTNNALGMSIDDVAKLHARWAERQEIDINAINRPFFVVADEGMSPDLHPKTVLIVKRVDKGGVSIGEGKCQAVRVLASNTGAIIRTIESGKHGWEDFWRVAQENGGYFPGE
ncbi:hypothetical protein BDZ94DRAFT_782630 [Collybia nuda]|uniref:Uncharacterized protein n=1 Tax=Collybia nuda TaxID=64659 RepID=A0A9P5YE78_9AGAR|nr:hypothetical protein BDZ94DRAFT_782630 [Collybia nuda]